VIPLILEISLYLALALLIGYLFGWYMSKNSLKNRCKNREVNLNQSNNKNMEQELMHYKKVNKELISENTEIKLGYSGQKYVLDEHNDTLDEFQKRLKSKNNVIETLTSNVSLLEEEKRAIKEKYESEIDAFLFERNEITEKYKDLLEKFNRLKKHRNMIHEESLLNRIFSSFTPSKS
jgi:uncharacterized protein YneF (UPF0154 family)